MDIHVYDTYVKAKDGHTMHFDVITDKQDHDQAIAYAKEWLATVGEEGATVTGEECQFCHTQGAPEPVENEIKEKRPKDLLILFDISSNELSSICLYAHRHFPSPLKAVIMVKPSSPVTLMYL